MGRGLDIGTSFIISAVGDKEVTYREVRDAFIKLKPTSPVASSMMEKGLKGQVYFKDSDGSFIVIGQDAIERSVERHMSASRPMNRGIISPKEKDARRILKFILAEVLGKPKTENEKLIFSVPAQPVDQPGEEFDTGFHEDALRNDLRELGYDARAINEAEAICYSELDTDDYTGICLSFGAGMVNACVMSAGEAVIKFSTTKSGDWIDRMVAASTAQPDSVVQVEKENGKFRIGEEVADNSILSAVSSYYMRLIDYTIKHLVHQLKYGPAMPKFAGPIPIILSGGTSRPINFREEFEQQIFLVKDQLPFRIKEVRLAKDQLRSVARGCLIAAEI